MYSSTSLPEDLTIKESRIAGSGVFSSIHLRKGTLFGPYQGVKRDGRIDKTKLDTSYYWAVSSFAYFLYQYTMIALNEYLKTGTIFKFNSQKLLYDPPKFT